MKNSSLVNISIGDVARAAGVSKATVSYVLNNQAGPSQETRERVLQIARRLNYTPDARVHSFMAKVREAKSKNLLPIAWLNANPDGEMVWQKYKFLSPYREGAQERCAELGYRLEEIWAKRPGMTMGKIARMLYQRGIEGIIITFPIKHVRLNWEKLAGVSLEGSLLAPRLNRVRADSTFNLQLAIKSVRHLGYRRIGICLTTHMDIVSEHRLGLVIHHFYTTSLSSERVKPLFHSVAEETLEGKQTQFTEWLRREKPAVVIGNDGFLVQWVREAGYRVPEDVGVVNLSIDDDVLDWAGIYSHRKVQGQVAVEQVISLIQNCQFGVPKVPTDTYVRGYWHLGKTVLSQKGK